MKVRSACAPWKDGTFSVGERREQPSSVERLFLSQYSNHYRLRYEGAGIVPGFDFGSAEAPVQHLEPLLGPAAADDLADPRRVRPSPRSSGRRRSAPESGGGLGRGDLRRYGTVPHAGFGLGFERTPASVRALANVRDAIRFARTPETCGVDASDGGPRVLRSLSMDARRR